MSEQMADGKLQGYRLSPIQRRRWQRAADAGPRASECWCSIALSGGLDVVALRRAWSEVRARHGALRTVLRRRSGMQVPLQVVEPPRPALLAVVDLGTLAGERRQAALAGLGALAADSAVEAVLARCGTQEHRLLLAPGALRADAVSLSVVYRELADAYAAAGGPPADEEEPVQYLQYSEWLHQAGGELDPAAEEHWWSAVREACVAPPWVAPVSAEFRPRRRTRSWDAARRRRIEDLAARLDGSVAVLLQSLTCTLLGRHVDASRPVLATVFDGRGFEELERCVGPLSRCLPVAVELGDAPSFAELVVRWAEAVADAGDHMESFPATDADAAWTVEVRDDDPPALEADGVRFRLLERRVRTRPAAVRVLLELRDDGVELCVETDRRRVPDVFGDLLADALETLLEAVLSRPSCRVDDLGVVGTAEHRRFVTAVNDTVDERPVPAVQQAVARHAAADPGAPALVRGDEVLSRGDLDGAVAALARRLAGRGVGPETVVALHADRSFEMVVGLLAILRAGGAYLPLDPELPAERLRFMAADAGAGMLLSWGKGAERLAATTALDLVRLDDDGDGHLAGREPTGATAGSGQLAYVLYTSGSTGRPKGIQVPHGALSNYLAWAASAYRPGNDGPVLCASPLSFDFTVTVLLLPLFAGGVVELLPGDDVGALGRRLGTAPAPPLLKLTPAHLDLLRASLPQGPAAPAATLVLGGEAARADAIEWWRSGAPDGRVVNEFGPTETTVGCLTWEAEPGVPVPAEVPVGRPIRNTEVHLLSPRRRRTPAGAVGEIHVAGAGLARGYVGAPALTADAFRPHPEPRFAGQRLYATGDLGRIGADRELRFHGRRDQQMKLRGFRIEPGEIEVRLAAQPQVERAAVVLRDDDGERRLTAYVVAPGDGAEVGEETLRVHLGEHLPAYMVPVDWVFLDALPLSRHGKVDRGDLPAPQRRGGAGGGPPRTPEEEVVAAIWCRVLGLDGVGREDDFFNLGGHSLLATQAVSRIAGAFDVQIEVRQLFDHPTVESLAAWLQDQQAGSGPELPPLEAATDAGAPPLSFAQERLWFLDTYEPEQPWYNVPAAVRLGGSLDVPALRAALQGVVDRHQALRTRFVDSGGRPVQVVSARLPLEVPLVDLEALPAGHRRRCAAGLARWQAARPFSLSRGPLVRIVLLRLAADDHRVLLTLHHIVSDAWSAAVLVRETAALYTAVRSGEPAALPPLDVQYPDFARWQRRLYREGLLDDAIATLARRLRGAPTVLELPADRPRPAIQSFRGGLRSVRVPAPLTAALRRLARGHDATLFMGLLAAFQVLVARYTGSRDFLLGVPIAGRHRHEVENLVGFFVNTLVLRAELGDDPTFPTLLARVRESSLEAFARQDVPFERLVEELQPERSLAHLPLVQVIFQVQNVPRPEAQLEGLTVEMLDPGVAPAKFDLVMTLSESGDGLVGSCSYNADLFDASRIERLVRHYHRLLAAVVEDADRPVSALPLLTAAERHQVRVEWNRARPEPVEDTLHGRFAARARCAPEAVAVSHRPAPGHGPPVRLTYGELERRSDVLARRLVSRGVVRGDRIALCLRRDVGTVVSLLAVLKTGAAYLPLDPDAPPERLRILLQDGGPALLLADRVGAEGLPEDVVGGLPSLWLEETQEGAAGADPGPPAVPCGPADAAYVIFTSGSTGRPKGVVVEHRQALRLFDASRSLFSFGAADVWTWFHSYAFDFSVWEIWGALLHGGCLAVVPRAVSREPDRFRELVHSQGVTVLNQTPSAFRQLATGTAQRSALRWVIFGGEALDFPSLAPWFERFGDRRPVLVNMYGITETTVHVTYRRLSAGDTGTAASVIGMPLPDLRLHVLSPELEPQPIGVPGELFVGGAGVARGYLGRPGLTAERFLPDPFAGEPGSRVYRSGDLGRRRRSGEVEYLGRLDRQVKIRGFRIELGEIEAALTAQPSVTAAVVAKWQVAADDDRLVAWVVPAAGTQVGAGELRRALETRLPEHMIPFELIPLPALPLTANGKVDFDALPEPRFGAAGESTTEPPRNAREELLCALWQQLLGRERIGVHDDFFELGGHSLLATQAVARIRESFDVEVGVRIMFENPTVAELAAALESVARSGDAAPPVTPASRAGTLPLSFGQHRLWFLQRLDPELTAYNLPFAVYLEGELDVAALGWAWNRVVRRHEVLRTSFPEQDGLPVQSIHAPRQQRLPMVDLSGLGERRRRDLLWELAHSQVARPFDLAAEVPLRVSLVRAGAGEHSLLLTVHHLLADGGSGALMLEELSQLYRARVDGEPSPLPELPIQYADFAVWQRELLSADFLRREVEWWKRSLAGAPERLVLPTDTPREVADRFSGGSVAFTLEPELTERLRLLGRDEGATPFMLLLTVYQVLLALRAGRDDVLVGAPVSYRERPELQGLIGLFVNLVVLRLELGDDVPPFRRLLGRARKVVLEAFDHQAVPFERLVEELGLERAPGSNPLVQATFSFETAYREERVSDLSVALLSFDTDTAQFDLQMNVTETPERFRGSLGYRQALFDAHTAESLVGDYRLLLARVVADPDVPLSVLADEVRAAAEVRRESLRQRLDEGPASGFRRGRRRAAVRVADGPGDLRHDTATRADSDKEVVP